MCVTNESHSSGPVPFKAICCCCYFICVLPVCSPAIVDEAKPIAFSKLTRDTLECREFYAVRQRRKLPQVTDQQQKSVVTALEH